MIVQTSKGRLPRTHKELIRRFTFEYVKLLPLKSPQNKVVSNITITEKKKKKHIISYMPESFWDKVIEFTDEPVVQDDIPGVTNTSWWCYW